jgi:hypothetical protein
VFAVVVHTLVTYCEPAFGLVQFATAHVALAPALVPEAV